MNNYNLRIDQYNGRMIITLFRDSNDKKPIIWSRSVAMSQWEEARKHLLIRGLEYIVKELKGRRGKLKG